jgi:hypothetical protein
MTNGMSDLENYATEFVHAHLEFHKLSEELAKANGEFIMGGGIEPWPVRERWEDGNRKMCDLIDKMVAIVEKKGMLDG